MEYEVRELREYAEHDVKLRARLAAVLVSPNKMHVITPFEEIAKGIRDVIKDSKTSSVPTHKDVSEKKRKKKNLLRR